MIKLYLLIILLLLSPPVYARMTSVMAGVGSPVLDDGLNDFSTDSNCVALYNFESGALETDSKSTNTLSAVNSPTAYTTGGYYKQGSASVWYEAASSENHYIDDSGLPSGFPLKSDGTTKNISISFWVLFDSFAAEAGQRTLFAKWESSTNKRSLILIQYTSGTDNTISLGIDPAGTGGGGIQWADHTSDLSLDTWYHITATWDNANKLATVRIRDTSGNTVGSDLTPAAFASAIYVSSGPMSIGAVHATGSTWGDFMDGNIDELVIFKDIITSDEATKIAKGLYP